MAKEMTEKEKTEYELALRREHLLRKAKTEKEKAYWAEKERQQLWKAIVELQQDWLRLAARVRWLENLSLGMTDLTMVAALGEAERERQAFEEEMKNVDT